MSLDEGVSLACTCSQLVSKINLSETDVSEMEVQLMKEVCFTCTFSVFSQPLSGCSYCVFALCCLELESVREWGWVITEGSRRFLY